MCDLGADWISPGLKLNQEEGGKFTFDLEQHFTGLLDELLRGPDSLSPPIPACSVQLQGKLKHGSCEASAYPPKQPGASLHP